MLPLESLDAVQHSVQMVFFTGEVDKFPRQDSSIGTHDAAHRIGVESKVYCTNASFGGRGIGEQDLLLESKAQIVFAIVLLQRGRRRLGVAPSLLDVLHIRGAEPHLHPHPVAAAEQLQVSAIRGVPGAIHFLIVEHGHGVSLQRKVGFSALLPGLSPISVVGMIAAHCTKCRLNCSPAQITGHFEKPNVEIVLCSIILRAMHQFLRKVEPFLCALDSRKRSPLALIHFQKEGECGVVDIHSLLKSFAVCLKHLDLVA